MPGLSERLAKIPAPARIALLVIFIVICAGLAWNSMHSARDYEQGDIPMKCLECGFTETLSVAAHHARVQKELPGGAPLIEGPELICPNCGKKAEVVAPPPPPPTQPPQ